MKFGIAFAHGGPAAERDYALRFARVAEDCGFESLWTAEHIVVPEAYESSYPYSEDGRMVGGADEVLPDPLAWLSFVSGVTDRIRLATGIVVLPLHNPVALAKTAATMDRLAPGRIMLGIGAGWMKEEFDVLRVPWERRGTRLEEYVEILRALWQPGAATHRGEFFNFQNAHSQPKPTHPAAIPIVIGGHSERSARRAGRLGDGFFPVGLPPADLAPLIRAARRAAADAGRDPDALEVTTVGSWDPTSVASYAKAGVDRVLLVRRRASIDDQERLLREWARGISR